MLFPASISYLTMFGWFRWRRTDISLRVVLGTPSSSTSNRIFCSGSQSHRVKGPLNDKFSCLKHYLHGHKGICLLIHTFVHQSIRAFANSLLNPLIAIHVRSLRGISKWKLSISNVLNSNLFFIQSIIKFQRQYSIMHNLTKALPYKMVRGRDGREDLQSAKVMIALWTGSK